MTYMISWPSVALVWFNPHSSLTKQCAGLYLEYSSFHQTKINLIAYYSTQNTKLMWFSILAPSTAPCAISETDVGSNHLTLQWSELPCGSRHGELSYIYRLKSETDAVVNTGTSPSTTATIEDLDVFTRYTFEVAAVTDFGEGPWSDIFQTATRKG